MHGHKDGFQPVPQFQISMDARGARLSLPRKLKGSIMASTSTRSGIWGMSAHAVVNRKKK
jgi:hypothetical protein